MNFPLCNMFISFHLTNPCKFVALSVFSLDFRGFDFETELFSSRWYGEDTFQTRELTEVQRRMTESFSIRQPS